MFPKKKLASITITDLNRIKKRLDLEANRRKVWLKANAKFQIVNHKRYLIVDFCGVQDGTAAVILKGLYSKDDYWYYYPDLDRFSHKMLDEHLWNMGAEVDAYADLKTKKIAKRFLAKRVCHILSPSLNIDAGRRKDKFADKGFCRKRRTWKRRSFLFRKMH